MEEAMGAEEAKSNLGFKESILEGAADEVALGQGLDRAGA
ncbi:uncharacterized protein G2W53_015775 [Senna tora]|uniref:Uncharacterized protein n=1 Tax=Senna tora TaxID=362788 RepID=A0A834WWE3_9FABA|nr:uncharacterized protein G2W53_015775 [Senna tora]